MKYKIIYIISILFILVNFGCNNLEGKKSLNTVSPYFSDTYNRNNPLSYIPIHENCIYVMRESIGYWSSGILEIPKFYDTIDGELVKNLVFYDFDIETVNKMLVQRDENFMFCNRSVVRNFMAYIFEMKFNKVKGFEKLKQFDLKYYRKLLSKIARSDKRLKGTYFVLDGKTKEIYWIDPYDGFSKNEKLFLKKIKPIMFKISFKEKCYFNKLIGVNKDCDSYKNNCNYIIPSDEIK
jgi:hypothetical protein